MLTLPQATLFLDLLFKLFPSDWPIIYKSTYYRITNAIKLSTKEGIDNSLVPLLDTKNDLALLALASPNPNSKRCAELIISVLTHEQLLELLENIFKLQLATRDKTCSSVEAISTLFRGDNITCYLLDELLKTSKKQFAAKIQNECNDFINAIVKDIKLDPLMPLENILADYTMSENCAQTTAMLLPQIQQKILHALSSEPIINVLLALIKKYAQQDHNTDPNKLKDFQLGNLANRVVSSILSRYVIHFKQKDIATLNSLKKTTTHVAVNMNLSLHQLQSKNLKWLIAYRFLAKPFTYLIATDPVEKPIQNQKFPASFHSFLLNRDFKFSYINYCARLQLENGNHLFCNKHSTQFNVIDALGMDVFDNELQLGLWVAAIEIYKEFHVLREKNNQTPKHITSLPTLQNQTQLRLQYFPNFIKELCAQMGSLLNIATVQTEDGKRIIMLIEKIELLKKLYSSHFEHVKLVVTSPRSTNRDSKEELTSPRVRFSTEPPAEIPDSKSQSPRNLFKS